MLGLHDDSWDCFERRMELQLLGEKKAVMPRISVPKSSLRTCYFCVPLRPDACLLWHGISNLTSACRLLRLIC